MAKKAYYGINNIARNVSKIYVGVNNTARKVLKGYVGDANGVARLFFDDSTPAIPTSWDYWTTQNNTTFAMIGITGRPAYVDYYQKINKGIAYYALFKVMRNNQLSYGMVLISPMESAVKFKSSQGTYTYTQSFTDSVGLTWYYAFSSNYNYARDYYIVSPEGCILPDIYPLTSQGILQAAQDLLDLVYDVPFHENYVTGQIYTLGITDIQKTIRKAMSTALYKKVGVYSSHVAYTAFSDNVDTIITTLFNMNMGI